MKLTIESTHRAGVLDGVEVRCWEGVTEQGHRIDVFVHRLLADQAAQPELDAAVAAGELEDRPLPGIAAGDAAHASGPLTMYGLREHLFALMAQYEETCLGGKACWQNRAAAMGWLCHAIGLGKHPGAMDQVLAFLAGYDRDCRSAECGHKVGEEGGG
jgi:hypothetical protein